MGLNGIRISSAGSRVLGPFPVTVEKSNSPGSEGIKEGEIPVMVARCVDVFFITTFASIPPQVCSM